MPEACLVIFHPKITLIGYTDFVVLTEKHHSQMAW
ncbi:sulfur transfer complex subunit TusB [Serratia fonticola]|uniref:Sulfur transfer complex subunit TusB n=1 Tax=Serratia fonticola TaxID=47917 RepID=A0A4U9WLQ1_SERFO|nr:sulfur transfer complex subunit TusB [Serratia fonticola]